MISAEEAIKIVLANTVVQHDEEVDISNALGRVLREDVTADRDFPPFDRVAMDGIAVNHKAWEEGKRKFQVEGVQLAGSPQMKLSQGDHCIEVMTGAMLPENTDVVIRYEDVQTEDGLAEVDLEAVKRFQNIHRKGTDRKTGEVLIPANRILSPAEIGVLCTVGKVKVRVARSMQIAIVSTGDELVEINEMPEPHQIRKSNVYALQASLQQMGHMSVRYHIKDEEQVLKTQLAAILNDHDLVILSGGVSKGKKDYVPAVLETLHVQKLFHGVKQRPGKPFWFGTRKGERETVIFALPGNPVSTFMCFYRYVKVWIERNYGVDKKAARAILAEDFEFIPELTYYLQVKLNDDNGTLLATPIAGRGSGDLANLLEADGFLELPEHASTFLKGDSFPVYCYRDV